MSRKEQTKEFLGNWYIIDAAKNWFGLHLTFNQCDDIRQLYHQTPTQDGKSEDKFEQVLIAYDKKRKEDLEDDNK